MRDFGKIPPEYIYPMMLLCIGALMIGRSLVRPFITPFANDALGACGLALTMCAVVLNEIIQGES
jgi:hypothetical protein